MPIERLLSRIIGNSNRLSFWLLTQPGNLNRSFSTNYSFGVNQFRHHVIAVGSVIPVHNISTIRSLGFCKPDMDAKLKKAQELAVIFQQLQIGPLSNSLIHLFYFIGHWQQHVAHQFAHPVLDALFFSMSHIGICCFKGFRKLSVILYLPHIFALRHKSMCKVLYNHFSFLTITAFVKHHAAAR